MATELVNSATSEKLADVDWTKNIEICELVARDQRLTYRTLQIFLLNNICLWFWFIFIVL